MYNQDLNILQVNVGLRCNLSCFHCHLNCGPDRDEMMDWETMAHTIKAAGRIQPDKIDITGGSPELNPHLCRFIKALRKKNRIVQVRTNLTVLLEDGGEDLCRFFKDHEVQVVASLPCYQEEDVCKQRGRGVYEKSIKALYILNSLGYGREPELVLTLVYNPVGPFLPGSQAHLGEEYRRELSVRFGLYFTNLIAITNMPIGRFWERLKQDKMDKEYMKILYDGFNCQTVEDLMCRHQINVGWDGTLYDCDFNLALKLSLGSESPWNIRDLNPDRLVGRKIKTNSHCFGCTAGFGSSCSGSLVKDSSSQQDNFGNN